MIHLLQSANKAGHNSWLVGSMQLISSSPAYHYNAGDVYVIEMHYIHIIHNYVRHITIYDKDSHTPNDNWIPPWLHSTYINNILIVYYSMTCIGLQSVGHTDEVNN